MLEEFERILYGKNKLEKRKNKFINYQYIKFILIAFLLAMLINKYIIFTAHVPTGSMIPTLNVGDNLLVSRVYNLNSLERGDIVVFHSNESEEYMVKRLIGFPGENIYINSGYVYVNGEFLNEKYDINRDEYTGGFNVPEGKYFFLGDNRPVSYDSRMWDEAYIGEEEIVGIVKLRIYPFNGIESIK